MISGSLGVIAFIWMAYHQSLKGWQGHLQHFATVLRVIQSLDIRLRATPI